MKTGNFFIGAIIGGAAGAVAAVLFAPQSGKEMRKQLHNKKEDLINEFEKASQDRRSELENELHHLQNPTE